jgi:hypothetical protein
MEDGKIKNFLEQVDMLGANAISVSKKMLESGKENVTVELVRKKIMPERFETPPRAHVCHEAFTFQNYIDANKTGDTVILMDVENEKVYAILDDKAARGYEIILLAPALDPRYQMLQETMLNKRLRPKKFAEAVLMNKEIIAADDDKDKSLPMILKQITIANVIKATEGTGAKSMNGVVCETTIKAGTGSEEIILPESIVVETPIYLKTEIKRFSIQIVVIPESSTEVTICTKSPEAALAKCQVFEKMIEPLQEIECLTGFGKPVYGQWNYNR